MIETWPNRKRVIVASAFGISDERTPRATSIHNSLEATWDLCCPQSALELLVTAHQDNPKKEMTLFIAFAAVLLNIGICDGSEMTSFPEVFSGRSECGPGYVFCLDAMRCVPEDPDDCRGGVNPFWAKDESVWCPPGHTLCLEENTCVPMDAEECAEEPPILDAVTCLDGAVFCFESMSCISDSPQCSRGIEFLGKTVDGVSPVSSTVDHFSIETTRAVEHDAIREDIPWETTSQTVVVGSTKASSEATDRATTPRMQEVFTSTANVIVTTGASSEGPAVEPQARKAEPRSSTATRKVPPSPSQTPPHSASIRPRVQVLYKPPKRQNTKPTTRAVPTARTSKDSVETTKKPKKKEPVVVPASVKNFGSGVKGLQEKFQEAKKFFSQAYARVGKAFSVVLG